MSPLQTLSDKSPVYSISALYKKKNKQTNNNNNNSYNNNDRCK